MARSDWFDKNHYVENIGWFVNINRYCKDLRSKILNRSTKFLKSNKEMKESIIVSFQFDNEDNEYNDLDDCCQEAVDNGYNYCPDCGNCVEEFKEWNHRPYENPYQSIDDKRIRNEYPTNEEEFIEAYIRLYDEDEDYFDTINIYNSMYMQSELFDKVKEDLQKEGISLE